MKQSNKHLVKAIEEMACLLGYHIDWYHNFKPIFTFGNSIGIHKRLDALLDYLGLEVKSGIEVVKKSGGK